MYTIDPDSSGAFDVFCDQTMQQPVGGGQCSRRDWMALLISTAARPTTKMASVFWLPDWTRYTARRKQNGGNGRGNCLS